MAFRVFVAALLITISASADEKSWVLTQSEFIPLTSEKQQEYLNLVFTTLSSIEKQAPELKKCINAGEVFESRANSSVSSLIRKNPKTSSCTRPTELDPDDDLNPDIKCPQPQFSCASYFDVIACLDDETNRSRTEQCYSLVTDKKSFRRFFTNQLSLSIWGDITQLLNEYCSTKVRKNSSCSELETWKKDREKSDNKSFLEYFFKSSWLKLVLTPAYAVQPPCSYDEKTQYFRGKNGSHTKIIFALHGIPSQVYDYRANRDKNPKEAANKLMKAHEHSIPGMEKTYFDAYEQLKKQRLHWTGIENEDNFLQKSGGNQYLFKRINEDELRLKQAGLSARQIKQALIVLHDPQGIAWHQWAREQGMLFKKNRTGGLKQSVNQVKVRGVDNNRLESVDKLEDKYKLARTQEDQAREKYFATDTTKIVSASPDAKDKASEHTAIMDFYGSLDHKNQENQLKKLNSFMRSKDYQSLSEESKKNVQNYYSITEAYLKAQTETIKIKTESDEESKKEFKLRDQGMAKSINENAQKHGDGFIMLGAAHKDGVIENLKKECLQQSNGTTSSTRSGQFSK